MALLLKILSILSWLKELWNLLQGYLEARRIRIAEEKRQKREQALKDAQKAQTPDEAYDAQTGVIDNEP